MEDSSVSLALVRSLDGVGMSITFGPINAAQCFQGQPKDLHHTHVSWVGKR